MKIHFVMHESFEAPAAIESWARKNQHSTSFTRLYAGDTFPTRCDFDFLIIMGGPQCPVTTKEECPHFDGPGEIALIKKAIDENKLVLGICLGAQLIGQALGAQFDHSPNREIGVFPLRLTEDGRRDPIFCDFPETFDVGHWHGDMPGLTADAKVLATSDGCPRQIVRYTPKVYGFQCHFEFSREAIEAMIENNAGELRKYRELPFVESPEELLAHDFGEINEKVFLFLDRFTVFTLLLYCSVFQFY